MSVIQLDLQGACGHLSVCQYSHCEWEFVCSSLMKLTR